MANNGDLIIDDRFKSFIETEVLPLISMAPDKFWAGLGSLIAEFSPRHEALLQKRYWFQEQIDAWHEIRVGQPHNVAEYESYLRAIGYIVPEPDDFVIETMGCDVEIAGLAGPQLVVPVLNERFVLNAANARWGSLYDVLYGTDAILPVPKNPGFDPSRSKLVVRWAQDFLDSIIPNWRGALRMGALHPNLFGRTTNTVIFHHHGLHIEIVIDPDSDLGRDDEDGICDIQFESALSTIVDFEDSVACVDAEDKIKAYRNWLGLLCGSLEADFVKNNQNFKRKLSSNKLVVLTDGSQTFLKGRALLMARNVGLHMTTPILKTADGSEIYEGIVDALVTSLIAQCDQKAKGGINNSAEGYIYIVKPKLHGPDEVALVNDLFGAVERILGLKSFTIKIGVMDEERRTSVNLKACIYAIRQRLCFINTGFLDRTGDEIHTSMKAGALCSKSQMKNQDWIKAYETRNVAIGLACGLKGRAQIGKGMWAAPDQMKAMLEQKQGHVLSGATTAWVPSPAAATLHALHYHMIDVNAVQATIGLLEVAPLSELLKIPYMTVDSLSPEEIKADLETNAQSLLGYVVRWIDQGIGCSKVPDLINNGLMEDRATLRISAQAMANWLYHNVCSQSDIEAALKKMALRVDDQNSQDPLYQPMAKDFDRSLVYQAARALIYEGANQANGYTESILHWWRLKAKANQLLKDALLQA
jgi:malate synthase